MTSLTTPAESSPLSTALSDVLPDYEIPADDLVGEVLIPAMRHADEVRVGTGFFSSQCLAQLAPGLADYLASNDRPLRLLLSPGISQEDRKAIERGLTEPRVVIEETSDRLFQDATLSPSSVVQHTLACLSFLIASERLELRFVLMNAGTYHKKQWLFRCQQDNLAVHGSGNFTTRGLLMNGEQMTIDRDWCDGSVSAMRVSRLNQQWERQWNNQSTFSVSLTALQGLPFVPKHVDAPLPTASDFWTAWRKDRDAGLEPELPPSLRLASTTHQLSIPDGLHWESGTYAHQASAVRAFITNAHRGVLSIATGGGKTKTALIAATRTQNSHTRPLLIVILVPSRPLMMQWAEEVREFGIEPLLPSFSPSEQQRSTDFELVRTALSSNQQRTEVIITTNRLFARNRGITSLVKSVASSALTLLIADEVHNLGVPTFLCDPPDHFHYRLGLSATPIRQYDIDGTDQLFGFFGEQVFSFSLEDAIRAGCLVPYRYHLHEIDLTAEETELYQDLSDQLFEAGFRIDDDGQIIIPNPTVERLLRDRRAVLEQAESKILALRTLLMANRPDNVRRTLIYVSAKKQMIGSKQLDRVNRLLHELGIPSHQYTNAETSRRTAKAMLREFADGRFGVLTAMKVLDEGIDIPQTDTAFLLASSTVKREWIQRRGRILRTAPDKHAADLHDFLAVPPDLHDQLGRSVLRGELRRADHFACLATNEYEPDGPRETIGKYEEAIWEGVNA